MNEKQTILVNLDGFAENERVIFKLIFSVSQRTKNRRYSYDIASSEEKNPAEINIVNLSKYADHHTHSSSNEIISIVVVDQLDDGIEQPCLLRPLIASRVLATLDGLHEQRDSNETGLKNLTSAEEQNPERFKSNSTSMELDEEGEQYLEEEHDIHFSISEDEACELAIVHDESLENSANQAEVETSGAHGTEQSVNLVDQNELDQANHLVLVTSKHTPVPPHNSEDNDTALGIEDNTATALVVDDSASVRKQLEIELNLFDVRVDYAANAQQAFEMLNGNHYDVAFLDVVLPDQDGFEICKHIKSSANETSVIMLTGKATPADKVKGSLAGCDAYLVKPVGRMTFQNAVKNYLPLLESVKAMGA